MNVKRGIRRLAVLFGMVGAFTAAFFSYPHLQTLMRQQQLHDRFEHLSSLKVVRKAVPTVQDFPNDPWRVSSVGINEDGIRSVRFSANNQISSIKTSDGTVFYPIPAPGLGRYFLIFLIPVAGFLLPWSATRGIEWAGSGFMGPPPAGE